MIVDIPQCKFNNILAAKGGIFPSTLTDQEYRIFKHKFGSLAVLHEADRSCGTYKRLAATSALYGICAPTLMFVTGANSLRVAHFWPDSGVITLSTGRKLTNRPEDDFSTHHEFGHALQTDDDEAHKKEFHSDAFGVLRSSAKAGIKTLHADVKYQSQITGFSQRFFLKQESARYPSPEKRISYIEKRNTSETWKQFVEGKRHISELMGYIEENMQGRF